MNNLTITVGDRGRVVRYGQKLEPYLQSLCDKYKYINILYFDSQKMAMNIDQPSFPKMPLDLEKIRRFIKLNAMPVQISIGAPRAAWIQFSDGTFKLANGTTHVIYMHPNAFANERIILKLLGMLPVGEIAPRPKQPKAANKESVSFDPSSKMLEIVVRVAHPVQVTYAYRANIDQTTFNAAPEDVADIAVEAFSLTGRVTKTYSYDVDGNLIVSLIDGRSVFDARNPSTMPKLYRFLLKKVSV